MNPMVIIPTQFNFQELISSTTSKNKGKQIIYNEVHQKTKRFLRSSIRNQSIPPGMGGTVQPCTSTSSKSVPYIYILVVPTDIVCQYRLILTGVVVVQYIDINQYLKSQLKPNVIKRKFDVFIPRFNVSIHIKQYG